VTFKLRIAISSLQHVTVILKPFTIWPSLLTRLLDETEAADSPQHIIKNVAEKAEPLLSSFAEANQAYEDGDYELALIDYMMAAEQGYEKGQANVAYLLDQEKSKWPLPSPLSFGAPRSPLLRNAELALIYWTRSAKQTNIDSMVKMGDYYLNGIGTRADMEKAVSCYTGASEFHQSAQALYNLGWMHENGVGLNQDFHLAKRFYDQALETNEEAYLPVTLSLFKLRLRSAWNTFTHGRVNSIHDEPSKLLFRNQRRNANG
jgi:SEL1 protein